MSSPYTIRRTKIAPEDPILARLPATTSLAVPRRNHGWEPFLGFSGLSTIMKFCPGDEVTILAKVELAGDVFYFIQISLPRLRERGVYLQYHTFFLAARDGKIRAHVDLSAEDFLRKILALADPQSATLHAKELKEDLFCASIARLSEFSGRLLLSLRSATLIFDPESLVVLGASGACSAAVDPSSTTWPSCVALRWLGDYTGYRLVRLDLDLRVIAESEEHLDMYITGLNSPLAGEFVNFALTSRGQILVLTSPGAPEYLDLLRVFDPDLREVHSEPCDPCDPCEEFKLVAVSGRPESDSGETRLLLLKIKDRDDSFDKKSPGWLLEIEAETPNVGEVGEN